MRLTEEQTTTMRISGLRLIRAFLAEGGPRNTVTAPVHMDVPPGTDRVAVGALLDYLASAAASFLIGWQTVAQTDEEYGLTDGERTELARQRAEDWINTQILESSFVAGHNEDPRTAG